MKQTPVAHMSRGELEEELSAFRAAQEAQNARYDAVLEMIEHPPAPTPLLVKLMAEAKARQPAPPAVIATCGDCAYPMDDNDRATHDEPYWLCSHVDAPAGDGCELAGLDAEPPTWCPLRGKP